MGDTSYEQGANEAVQIVLDGLGVGSLSELKEIVDDGVYYRRMKGNGFVLRDLAMTTVGHQLSRGVAPS